MADTPPIRPQRGMVRNNRETTGGLLMSVIRSLTTSRDSADRDREKNELEKGFAQCDLKLNDLVSQHNNDLYQVMNTFSKILNNLCRSKERLLDTREKLQNCQKLLHCKRDELKKLWLEVVENRAVSDLLDRVEQVASLPKQVDSFASKKYYLHAAQCCVDGLRQLGEDSNHLNGSDTNFTSLGSHATFSPKNTSHFSDSSYGALSKIEALSDVRSELISKKEALFESSIEELHRHLYHISSADIRRRFHRHGSFRLTDCSNFDDPAHRSRKVSAIEILSSTSDLKKLMQTNNENCSHFESIANQPKDLNNSPIMIHSFDTVSHNDNNCSFDDYPEEDSKQFISMLTKCLGLLNKIPEAIDVIKERCDREFINIVLKTAQEVLSSGSTTTNATSSSSVNSQAAITKSTSLLDVSSIGSDSGMAVFESPPSNSNLVILTCTTLLDHCYNGYSHLQSNSVPEYRSAKSSLRLKDFFELLMQQYRTIISLHESIVLPNLQRIESGLHAFSTEHEANNESISNHAPTNFYSGGELWGKIYVLIQQLLDYYLDMSSMSNTGPIHANLSSNISNLLSPATLHFLFNSSTSSSTGASGNISSASGALPADYSSYFSKRRALAGAMNAMNAMTKNTMTAAVAAASGAANTISTPNSTDANSLSANPVGGSGSTSAPNSSNTLTSSTGVSNLATLANTSSTSNFLSSVVGSGSRVANHLSLFKFDNSSQAISWNTFLAEQHHMDSRQQANSSSEDKKDQSVEKDKDDNDTKRDLGNSSLKSTNSPSSVSNKLLESLRSICSPSLDNLIVLYGTLMSHANQCPNLNSESLDSAVSLTMGSNNPNNALHAYILTVAEKFSTHVNIQLEKMLETATKSLESGVTIKIPYDLSVLNPTVASFEEQENNANNTVDNISKVSTVASSSNANLYPPLLESAVLVDVSTRDLLVLIQAMPDYRTEFLRYICNVLNAFKDACTQTYRNIVQPSSSITTNGAFGSVASSAFDAMSANSYEKRIISANWSKDEDINRLLKSLPNWLTLQQYQKQQAATGGESNDSMHSGSRLSSVSKIDSTREKRFNHQMSSFDESPEEIRLRNMRETDILTSNLLQDIQKNKLLWQDGQLCFLAQLHESLEWLSARCDDLVSSLSSMQSEDDNSNNAEPDMDRNSSEVYVAILNQFVKDFSNLSETCLLVLHLEVRVHCFYHLQALDNNFFNSSAPHLDTEGNPISRTSTQDLYSDDAKIIPLLDDLKRMFDELQRASLKPHKMVYVFEGLGHLITTIFLNTASKLRRVKPNGVKRACRAIYDIQRRLSTITRSRELALDYARQYFELLLMTPDEILTTIIERGQQFQYNEYLTAITLLHHSGLANNTAQLTGAFDSHTTNLELERHVKRLNDILNGVTVAL